MDTFYWNSDSFEGSSLTDEEGFLALCEPGRKMPTSAVVSKQQSFKLCSMQLSPRVASPASATKHSAWVTLQ